METKMENNNYVKWIAGIIAIALVVFAIIKINKGQIPKPSTDLTTQVSYSCDAGKTIEVTYYNTQNELSVNTAIPPIPNGRAKVDLSDGRSLTLNQTMSADGVRYANPDETFVFWSKGNGALVLENNVEKSYIGCVEVLPEPENSNLDKIYSSGQDGFSIRYADGYTIDNSYKYQLSPDKNIFGTKFTIPESMTEGTNLSTDSYLSVESIPQTQSCTADLFLFGSPSVTEEVDNGVTYSVAMNSDAAAGNRYEESVYAIVGTNPCIAIRYFIHYGAFENYPEGSIVEFDKNALLQQFDDMRHTLVINQ